MRKTYIKESVRNIKKKFVPFISVSFIAALAVMAFLGISYGGTAIRNTSYSFYSGHKFRDIEICSSKLFSQDDIEAIAATDGVKCAEGIFSASGQVSNGDTRQEVDVVSLTESINTPELIEGRMPQELNECVIEAELMKALGLSCGDTVSVTDHGGEKLGLLKLDTFTVTGVVYHPDHYFMKEFVDGSRYILVQKEAFDTSSVLDRYTKAVVRIESSAPYYSDKYFKDVENVRRRLDDLQDKRHEVFSQERSSKQTDIALANAEIEAAKKTLDEDSEQIDAAKKEITQKQTELNKANVELKSYKKELADAKQKLKDSRTELDEASKKLGTANAELSEGKVRLDIAKEELETSERTIAENEKKLESGRKELETAKKKLQNGFDKAEKIKADIRSDIKNAAELLGYNDIEWAEPVTEYDITDSSLSIAVFYITPSFKITIRPDQDLHTAITSQARLMLGRSSGDSEKLWEYIGTGHDLEDLVNRYDSIISGINEWESGHKDYINGYQAYKNGLSQLNAAKKEFSEGKKLYEAKQAEYLSKKAEYEKALKEYNAGEKEYQKGKEKYTKGKSDYNNGLAQYNDAAARLEEAKLELESKEKELSSGKSEYENAKNELHEASQMIDKLSGAYSWLMFDANGNGGFYAAKDSAEGFLSMAFTFGMIFMIVGAFVLYSTIARMIADQQKQVGTIKAMGFRYGEILGKYLIFGISSVCLGTAAGAAFSYFFVQDMLIDMNKHMFVTYTINKAFVPSSTAAVILCAVGVASVTAWISCRRLAAQPARVLLAGDGPTSVMRKKKSSKSRTSLYFRLIFRNIRTDWQRVTVTVISIAGCCILMTVGLTFADALGETINRQYGDIVRYDIEADFDPGVNENAEKQIGSVLKADDHDFTAVTSSSCLLDIGGKQEPCQMICAAPDELSRFISIADKKGRDIEIPDDGIIMTHSLADSAGLSVGDEITLYDNKMDKYSVKISGIYTFYIGQCIILSDDAYKKIFDTEPQHDRFLIKAENDTLPNELYDTKWLYSEKHISDIKKSQDDYLDVSKTLSWFLIILAGIMAFFIILDLVNMYVAKKKKEFIIMRINGFSFRHTIIYAALECVITTLAGVIIGVALGIYIGDKIVTIRETASFSFVHQASVSACIISAAITLMYSFLIHFAAFRKIKTYKITDIDQST